MRELEYVNISWALLPFANKTGENNRNKILVLYKQNRQTKCKLQGRMQYIPAGDEILLAIRQEGIQL